MKNAEPIPPPITIERMAMYMIVSINVKPPLFFAPFFVTIIEPLA